MLTSRITRCGLILSGLLSCLLCVEASETNSRPATLDEIQTLFNLATIWPQRERFVADITTYEPKWTREQIAAAIEQQNKMFPDMRKLPGSVQRDRTNAAAASHSGIQILHVQEWDSGNLYRLDQTDEGLVGADSPQYFNDYSRTYKQSFVDIDDPAISPYRSFNVNRQLHDIQLSKTALWEKYTLWRGQGLDQEVVFPLLVVLADSKSFPIGRSATDTDLGMLKLDPAKAERLQNGARPNWHLEAITESGQENRTRFVLHARIISMIEPSVESDMEFIYVVGRIGQKSVCLEASATNYTTHASFFSKRDGFDSQGFPHVWKRTSMSPDLPTKQVDTVFNEVVLNATFDDKQVFLPVFPTNYIVSDVTSGNAKTLQNPLHAKIARLDAPVTMNKRVVILCVFGIVTLSFLFLVFCHKDNKPIE